jgi:hypothetical protein
MYASETVAAMSEIETLCGGVRTCVCAIGGTELSFGRPEFKKLL